MKLAYVTTYNAQNLSGFYEWAGTGYYIARSLKQQFLPIHYIGSLKDRLALQAVCKFKRQYYEFFHQKKYLKALEPMFVQNYANQVKKRLANIEADIVFGATIIPIAYLECKQPIVFWADATFQNLLNFYPQYSNLCQETIAHGHLMEKLALEKCKLAIYSSEWAAQTAIDYYQADPTKVKVVPFGANIESNKTPDEIKDVIESRPSDRCKLLFIGVDWFRKGGDIALKVAEELNNLGLKTELTVVGCQPVVEGSLPNFVKPLGFVSKSTTKGKKILNQAIADSHFLILPSKAECYGLVLCEANSLGVPCLATQIAGIKTIIKPNINGNLFARNASINDYCNYIYHFFEHYPDYKNLAISAFNEYQMRLNWLVAGQTVKNLLTSIANGSQS
jgi:glycosyltransferase involved in cell wall biosynthesis